MKMSLYNKCIFAYKFGQSQLVRTRKPGLIRSREFLTLQILYSKV